MKPKRWRRQAKRDARSHEKQELRTKALSDLQMGMKTLDFLADSAAAYYNLSPQARHLYWNCVYYVGRGLPPREAKKTIPVGEQWDMKAASEELLSHELVYWEGDLLHAVHKIDDKGQTLLPGELLPNPPWLPFRVK